VAARLSRGVYAVTDCENLPADAVLSKSTRILAAGISALQFRDKSPPSDRRQALADALLRMCRQTRTPFIINDDLDLALAIRADGVHVGRDDISCGSARMRLGPNAIIGVSCYDSLELAQAAVDDGADYVAFGAFHPTQTKQARTRAGIDLLRAARATLAVPVVAIGGITPQNAEPLVHAGADLLAAVGSLFGTDTPERAVAEFNRLFTTAQESPEQAT
jgi:thiamine-phosphate pyrophosphorylase